MDTTLVDDVRNALDANYKKGFWIGALLVVSVIVAYHIGKNRKDEDD